MSPSSPENREPSRAVNQPEADDSKTSRPLELTNKQMLLQARTRQEKFRSNEAKEGTERESDLSDWEARLKQVEAAQANPARDALQAEEQHLRGQ